jgi:sugar/nucleoside kinase (ribokinase family)
MTYNFDIIVVGSYSIDLIFSGLREFPQLGKDIVGTDFKMTPGEAYISVVSMHRMGIKVGWAADFGTDDFSQIALECAREEGLDESLFVFHDRPYRRISAAASYPNDRAFITYYDPDPQVPAAIQALIKSQAKVLFIPGLYSGSLFNTGLHLIKAKKMKLVMDGNSSTGDIFSKNKQSAAIIKAIKSTDIFLPNAQETRRLTGESNLDVAIQRLGELCPLVVIKDGSNGSFAYINHQLIHIPAIPIKPIDTTGAGDNYNAGFLRAWFDNLPIEMCLKWGNILGALSTTELGGTTRKISMREVKELLTKTYGELES